MNTWIGQTCDFLLYSWENATLTDYGQIILAIVLVSWAFSRFAAR